MNKRVGPKVTEGPLGKSLVFLFNLKFVGDIIMFVKKKSCIVGQRGTKAYWINTLQNFKYNYVKAFGKYLCLKTAAEIRSRQRDTKAHYCQKC